MPRRAQLTLQPEWRKTAKDALDRPGVTDSTAEAARNIACLNGDPFNMILQQLNSVILSWIESGVNDFVIRPTNTVVHELNHVIDKVDDFLGGIVETAESIKEPFESAGNWLTGIGRRLDAQEVPDLPVPDFEALAPGRRLEAGALDNFSQYVYEHTGYGRRLEAWAEAGVPLKMARSGARPRGRRRTQSTDFLSPQMEAYSASNRRPPPPPAYDDLRHHIGKTPAVGLPYIPYVDDLCLDDPLKPDKPCMFGGEEVDWSACENPELAGGRDLVCYYKRVIWAIQTFSPASQLTVGVPNPGRSTRSARARATRRGTRGCSRRGTRTSRRPTRTSRRRSATALPTSSRRCTSSCSRRRPQPSTRRTWRRAATSA